MAQLSMLVGRKRRYVWGASNCGKSVWGAPLTRAAEGLPTDPRRIAKCL